MKRKTISKVIKNKLLEWQDSIKDEYIRNNFLKNVMVSGGCISSMLLKENVNDFDIYIKDINFLLKLTDYYVKEHNLKVYDGRLRTSYMEKYDIPEEEKIFEEYMAEEYVFVNNLHTEQVKIRVKSAGYRPTELLKNDKGEEILYQVSFVSQNAISLTGSIQIVTRFTGTIEEIHKNYDFVHATNYYTPETGLVTNIAALESILAKEMKYQGSLYPLTSIIRMKKFLLRGWSINAGEILKIMFQISELNLKDAIVLEEQLIGVDVAYFSTLLDIIRGTNKETITSEYLNTIIDRVFNETEDET